MRFSNDNTLLWREEPDCLVEYTDLVPDEGCIVEIGTAEGGTARIINELTSDRNIQVYSVDIDTSVKAKEILGQTEVKVINAASVDFAKQWNTEKRIDLLFIDGDHSFKGLYEDFYAWIPFLAEGGKVLIHDVDPPERGGLAHLGVKVFIDSLIREKIINETKQKFRFVYGSVPESSCREPDCRIFVETIKEIASETARSIEQVFAGGIQPGIKKLKKREGEISSYQTCCCVGYLLANAYHELLDAGDKFKIMRFAEMKWMLEHGFSDFVAPEDMGIIKDFTDYLDVSRFIARLQVALVIYRNIAEEIIEWEL